MGLFDLPGTSKSRKSSNNILDLNFNDTKSKTRTKCPPHLRTAIRRRWWGDDSLKGNCFCCGRDLHYDDAEVGHIKAFSKGGEWSPENCRLLCRQCNSGMKDVNMKIYMKKTYPERYEKYFPKDSEEKELKIKPIKKPAKKKKSNGIFDGDLFGSSSKGRKKDPFGF